MKLLTAQTKKVTKKRELSAMTFTVTFRVLTLHWKNLCGGVQTHHTVGSFVKSIRAFTFPSGIEGAYAAPAL